MSDVDSNFGFRLISIELVDFEYLHNSYAVDEKTTIAAKMDWVLNPELHVITSQLTVEYLHFSSKILCLRIENSFEIEEMTWLAVCDANRRILALPRAFLAQMGGIAIGTTRGILFEKTCQAGNSPLLLPLLDVGRLLTDNLVLTWK